MEPLAATILTAIAVLLPIGWAHTKGKRQQREARMVGVAGRINGEVQTETWRKFAAVQFNHKDKPAKLQFAAEGGESPTHYTDLTFFGDPRPFKMRLRPEDVLTGVGTALGMQDITVNDPRFDPKFVIRGAPVPFVIETLSPTVRADIIELYTANQNIDITLHSDGKITIRKLGWFRSVGELDEYVRLGKKLVNNLAKAHGRHWRAIAEARGLTMGQHAPTGYQPIVGTIGDVAVQTLLNRENQTIITARIPRILDITAIHKDHAKELAPLVPTGNPVLDMSVRVAGQNATAIQALLANPDVVDALLPVVHAYPGSMLRPDGVRLMASGCRLTDVGDLIDKAVHLAQTVHRVANS